MPRLEYILRLHSDLEASGYDLQERPPNAPAWAIALYRRFGREYWLGRFQGEYVIIPRSQLHRKGA